MENIVLQASIVKIKNVAKLQKGTKKLLSHFFFFFPEVVVTPYPVLHMEPQKVQHRMKRH